MSFPSNFIQDGRLPDIEYRTDAPEEIVVPRVTKRDGIDMVYLHNERDLAHQGFIPVSQFLLRLAKSEPNLAATGYRANGRQTTITFNKSDRVMLSPRLEKWLSVISASPDGKSAAIISFLANLMPVFVGEHRDGIYCARSVQDGTIILPINEPAEEEQGTVRVHWQGDERRESDINGSDVAALALDRYVRLHGAGASEDAIAAELWFMVEHFRRKTGCDVYLPNLKEPRGRAAAAGRTLSEMGQGVVANLFTKLIGI